MNPLAPFLFDMLAYPWALALLAGVAALLLAEIAIRTPGALNISTGETLLRIRTGRGAFLRRVPAVLRALGLAALIVALAGPLRGYQARKDRANIIDIMLCVDVSGSMGERDYYAGGIPQDRLYVTKAAVRDFIESRKEQRGGRSGLDRLGLVLYAGFAWTQSPLSLDYALLERELERAEVTTDQRKDGTAIGSALGLAVRRLSQSESKSKVIILLTDGLNNRGELDPITAARVASDYGVRVYTIGAGSPQRHRTRQPIDEDMLRKIAASTGGQYFRATDTEALHQAYAEIDHLERTEIDAGDYYEYRQAFVPYLTLGAMALLGSIFSRRRWFEAIP